MSVSNCSSLAGLELHLRTIPGRVGWGQSKVIITAISVQLQLQLPTGTELDNMFFLLFFDINDILLLFFFPPEEAKRNVAKLSPSSS